MTELLWSKLGKYLAGIAAFALMEASVFLWGDHHGRQLIQAQWDAQKVVMAKALADAQERSETISERVVTVYKYRIVTVQGATQTIIKKVPIYVTAKDDSQCIIPTGFVRVLDSSAEGASDLPATSSSANDAPAAIALSAIAKSVADNYGNVCRANAEQLSSLQDWIRQQSTETKKPSQ